MKKLNIFSEEKTNQTNSSKENILSPEDMWNKFSQNQINVLANAMRDVGVISVRMPDGYEYSATGISRVWSSVINKQYVDRGIQKTDSMYIVHYCIGDDEYVVDTTTDRTKAFKLRDLVEDKIKEGCFLEWLKEFKEKKENPFEV